MNNATPQDDYFSWCIAHPGVSNYAQVDGINIHYLEWPGPADAPCLLLVHGFMGHAHWWDFVAPALAQNYRVLAIDLSGMGDSGHRDEYTLAHRVAEIAGVIEQAKLSRLTLIGHSFGGRCTILTAYAHPHLMQRAITIDSHVSFPDPERERARVFNADAKAGTVKKRYADFDLAKSRFRLVPDESGTPPRVLDHIAAHSLKQDGDAWVWKFDDKITARGPKPEVSDARALPLLKVPLDFICGEHSRVVSPEHARQIAAAIRVGRAPIVIPAAYHHLLLGQPASLVTALRALLMENVAG